MTRARQLLSRHPTLPGEGWVARQRWLMAILWLHVAVLGLLVVAGGDETRAAALPVVASAVCATIAQLGLGSRQLRSALVATGLLSGSAALVVLHAGPAAAYHPFLVLVLLMLYEDWSLIALAVAFVGLVSFAGAGTWEPAGAHTLFFALAGCAGIVAGSLNANLRAEARAATQRFRTSFDSAPIGMAIVSRSGRFVDANDALCELLGRRRDAVLALSVRDVTVEEDRDDDAHLARAARAGDRRVAQSHKRLLHADGHTVWVNLSVSHAPATAGAPEYFIVQVEDVTERKRIVDELQRLADHDALTGLLNRRRLEEELAREIKLANRCHRSACLVLLDLDGFKALNDTLGHAAGDELLCAVADVLRARVRSTDVVARLGGDEFAILLPQATPEQARRVAEHAAQAIRERFLITGGREIRTTASFGVAKIAAGDTPSGVLLRADEAMYRVKGGGRDGVAVA